VSEDVPIGNIEKPLFAYFKMPFANNVDPKSPLGVAAYSRAVNLIKKADKLWSEFLWEFEGGELAINASSNLFPRDIHGNPIIPEGRERMFKDIFDFDGENFLKEFAPQFRDNSLFNGINRTVQRIEFLCGLAYGTISDPGMIDKTATEINAAKQRSYSTIHDTQASLEKALRDLVYSIDALTTLYNLAPAGKYELTFQWDDSIIVDAEAERLRDREEVRDGLMAKWEYRVKWYGETPETAKKMVSSMSDNGMSDDEILDFISEPEPDEGKADKKEG
jgi:A118 family predicted phage portal protein